MIIPLDEIVYDARARDGTWCRMKYPLHPNGCPNFPKCPENRPDFKRLPQMTWYAVVNEFDLRTHAEKMKVKHPHWSERQCRNVLYWQNSVRKRLRDEAASFMEEGDILLDIPEASGVHVIETMRRVGIQMQVRRPDLVKKVMLVGKAINQTTRI